jgi:hypothetical protein
MGGSESRSATKFPAPALEAVTVSDLISFILQTDAMSIQKHTKLIKNQSLNQNSID